MPHGNLVVTVKMIGAVILPKLIVVGTIIIPLIGDTSAASSSNTIISEPLDFAFWRFDLSLLNRQSLGGDRDRDHWRIFINQCNWTMFKLTCWEGFSMDAADFFKLKCVLHGGPHPKNSALNLTIKVTVLITWWRHFIWEQVPIIFSMICCWCIFIILTICDENKQF